MNTIKNFLSNNADHIKEFYELDYRTLLDTLEHLPNINLLKIYQILEIAFSITRKDARSLVIEYLKTTHPNHNNNVYVEALRIGEDDAVS